MFHSSSREKLHMLMALLSNAIFGFSFLFTRLAFDVAEPSVLLAVRFVVAFALMTVLAAAKIVPCHLRGKNIRPLIVLGILQPVLYFICESYGIKLTSTSFSGVIISLIPIVGLAMGAAFLRELPTGRQLVFSALSVAGVIVMTLTDGLGRFSWAGFILLLGAVASGALFNVVSRSVADRFTAFERTYVMFGVGSLVFTAVALVQTGGDRMLWLAPMHSGSFWISIVYLSFVSSIGAFMLQNKALDVLDVTRTLVFANVTTVISVLAGVFILGEHFSASAAAGIVMVLAGVYGVNRYTR